MNEHIQNNSKLLKKNYIVHIIIYGIIIIFNFILLTQIIWLKNFLYNLYFFGSIFDILYFIIPFFPLIYLLLKKFNKKNIKIFRVLTLIFSILSIFLGIYFSVIIMMNAIESPEFCRECPFNIDISYLYTEYNEYFEKVIDKNDNMLINKCSSRKCLLNNENKNNQFTFEFICNYNPTEEFEEFSGPFKKSQENGEIISSDEEIICNKIKSGFNFEKEIIYKYYDICNSFEDFYVCERFNEPSKYSLKEDFKCPNKHYLTYLIMFCVLNVFFNLILSFFTWKIEYNKYNDIIASYASNNRRRTSNSHNSTKNSSKLPKDNIQEKGFKKTPTEIILVCDEREKNNNIINNIFENENNIDNNINYNINDDINKININKINVNTINNIHINNSNEDNKDSNWGDFNKIQLYRNSEENQLHKKDIEQEKKSCNSHRTLLFVERVILADNNKAKNDTKA